eukprot:scaffold89344_cov17-Tisochrysis_lutea.AAC.1
MVCRSIGELAVWHKSSAYRRSKTWKLGMISCCAFEVFPRWREGVWVLWAASANVGPNIPCRLCAPPPCTYFVSLVLAPPET